MLSNRSISRCTLRKGWVSSAYNLICYPVKVDGVNIQTVIWSNSLFLLFSGHLKITIMKRLLLLITICISSVSFGQYTSIPDPNFEQALIDLGHDYVIDGQVLTSNISGVTSLNVTYKNIYDLAGIEDFSNLVSLYCADNQLTTLNLSQNPFLQHVSCPINQLTSIDVTQNTLLQNLFAGDNLFIDINVTQNPNLVNLDISSYGAAPGLITSLDISQNTNLEVLRCGNNPLSFLSLNNNSELTDLDISGTYITTLDVSNLENLRHLDIGSTGISQIDLTNNVNLESLGFGDFWYDELNNELLSPMSSINLSNNYLLADLQYYGGLLEYIDLSNLIGYSDITFESCFALECINLANGTNGFWDGSFINGGIAGGDPQLFDYFGLPPQPSLCIQVDDVNIANTLWVGNFEVDHPDYTFSTDCGDCLSTSNLTELNSNKPKELIKIVNLLGQEVEYTPNTILIYQYSDGTSEKVFTIED